MTSNSQLPTPSIFGIRHHGPGSARSLRAALEQLRPDAILVEGPPDAAEVLPLLAHPDMRPPVALLIYAPDLPRRAVYYPFALFSPEWQALHFGLTSGIPVRFMDLPQAHQLARTEEKGLRTESETPNTAPDQGAEADQDIDSLGPQSSVLNPDIGRGVGKFLWRFAPAAACHQPSASIIAHTSAQ